MKEIKILVNDDLEIIIEDKTITIKFAKELSTLDKLFEDWQGNPPEQSDWGEPVGKEIL